MQLFLTQARANRLINHRLLGVVAQLPDADFHAVRSSFFPSLALTLNHILGVDGYYLAALEGDAGMASVWSEYQPAKTAREMIDRQAASDERLIAVCAGLRPGDEERIVAFDRGQGIENGPREPVWRVLQHLFMHQHHHRGQVHAMLSSTGLKPPQLDDFILLGDAKNRVGEMGVVGWGEPT